MKKPSSVSDMTSTVKSREIQRGMLAEMRGDRPGAQRHLLAAAHLELVLAEDFAEAGDVRRSVRSRISAASCLWRAGAVEAARRLFDEIRAEFPERADEVENARRDLAQATPAGT